MTASYLIGMAIGVGFGWLIGTLLDQRSFWRRLKDRLASRLISQWWGREQRLNDALSEAQLRREQRATGVARFVHADSEYLGPLGENPYSVPNANEQELARLRWLGATTPETIGAARQQWLAESQQNVPAGLQNHLMSYWEVETRSEVTKPKSQGIITNQRQLREG